MVRLFAAALLHLLCQPYAVAQALPSVRQVVEFVRIIQPENHDVDQLRTQVSPDGRRAFLVTRRADVATDRNWFEILLLDVQTEHLAAGRVAAPRRVLAVDATTDDSYAEPFIRDVRWVGERTLVFMAQLHDGPTQVYRLDVDSGALLALTSEKRPIVSFAVSAKLDRVVYVVQVANPPMAPGARSVIVQNQSFWSVKFGQDDLRSQQRRYQYMAATAGDAKSARVLGPSFAEGSGYEPGLSISPDGRWALLPRYEPDRQAAWVREYPLVSALTNLLWSSRDLDPLSYYSRPTSYTVRKMIAWRLSDGREQTVVDAPDDALNGPGQVRSDRLWFGGGTSLVLAGTHLPIRDGTTTSNHSYIVEYWPDRDEWKPIAELEGRLARAYPLPGPRDAFVAVDGARQRYFDRQEDGSWRERASMGEDESASAAALTGQRWALRVSEGLNQPPYVEAVGPDGATVRLTNLNPTFDASTWGVMKPYGWTDRTGKRWEGGLMSASDSLPHGPRALVIQTYGFSGRRFYLDGANAYDGYTSGFAGRAFLGSDILVLAMPLRPLSDPAGEARAALLRFADGVRGAVDALVREGLVDPARVGIMGWSTTGEQVLNLVTFSDVPIRAASLLDGDANTLFSLSVTYGATDSIWSRKRRLNEGLPYGEGLERWIRYDPALHTDCIKAALRIETYGPWVLNNWDIYALLRQQLKPAEMVVIPGGTHDLSRPAERMVSLQGNVDWYRYWLQGQERVEPLLPGESAASLKEQYARWHQMEELKRADEARPACVRSWHE